MALAPTAMIGGSSNTRSLNIERPDNDNYTNGVDVHAGDSWIVRYNLFKNFS